MSVLMTADRGHPCYTCTLSVRWGDMDAYGHVNNVSYLRYLEEVRVQLFDYMGEGDIALRDLAPVVVNVACTYLHPVVYPDTLRANCWVGETGRSSFMIYYALHSESMQGLRCTEGSSKVVWTDKRAGKSVPLPESVRAWIEARHC